MSDDPDAKGAALWIILYLLFTVGGVAAYLLWQGIW